MKGSTVYSSDPVLDMACLACLQPIDCEATSNKSIGCEVITCRGFSSPMSDFYDVDVWEHIIDRL